MRAHKDLLDYMIEGLVDALWKLLKGLVVMMLVIPQAKADDVDYDPAFIDESSTARAKSSEEVKDNQELVQNFWDLVGKPEPEKIPDTDKEPVVEYKRIDWQKFGDNTSIMCRTHMDCALTAECVKNESKENKTVFYGYCVCFNQLGCDGVSYFTDGTKKVIRKPTE